MTCGRYIKRRNISGKCLFLPLKGSNFHLKYDFLPVVPFTSPQNIEILYRIPLNIHYRQKYCPNIYFIIQ